MLGSVGRVKRDAGEREREPEDREQRQLESFLYTLGLG
jgi:hypothetical protein